MKKTAVLLMMLLIVCVATAQTKTFSYGLKAGLNMSSFVGKDVDGAKMKPGFYAGVVTEFGISKRFAISPELLYSAQGAKFGDVKTKFNYLTLPLMAKFYATDKLSIDLGPQLDYALNAKNKTGDQTVKLESSAYKAFGVSASVGATYNFGKIFAQARYNYGLTTVITDAKCKNSVIQVGLGCKF